MIGGTGQKRCSGSLDCNSLTAAMGSRTNKGCQGRGTHKGHDQIASSPAHAAVLCPRRNRKELGDKTELALQGFLTLSPGQRLLAPVCRLLSQNSVGHAPGGSPHFTLLNCGHFY